MKAGYRGIGLALLIGLHLVQYVAFCPVGEPADSGALWSFAARSGAILAAPCLLGVWAALGPGRLFDRLPLTVMLAGSLTLAFWLGILQHGSMDPAMAFSQALPEFFVFLAVQIPLWPVRRFLGLRMHSVSFIVLLGVISLAALPCFWLILGKGTWHRPAVAVLLIALGCSTAAMVLNEVFIGVQRTEMLVLVISLQTGLFVSLTVSLLVLRWSGYRLMSQR